MIKLELMTPDEVEWVNNYHANCREKVAPLLRQQGKLAALAWLEANTRPLGK